MVPTLAALSHPPGFIYLRVGNHFVRNGVPSGYGVRHIWEGNKTLLRRRGLRSPEDIARFISGLMAPEAALYHDAFHKKAKHKRVTLLHTADGTLVLEPRLEAPLGFHYQVITWTPRTQPKGTRLGKNCTLWQ